MNIDPERLANVESIEDIIFQLRKWRDSHDLTAEEIKDTGQRCSYERILGIRDGLELALSFMFQVSRRKRFDDIVDAATGKHDGE